ncbi:MAG TPA: ABC transporter permease [Chthoniobacterales bacterium]|nr:ABC transporter permease [Chthoniobacterales bacterium]
MMHDLRFAVRQLWKAPGFTIAAVLVLTLGIGANTAVFSLVNTMLFAPPGYARPDELVQVFSQDTKNPKSFREFSYPTLNDIREQNSVFSGVAGFNVGMIGIGEKNNTRRVFTSLVSANYFEVLGVAPALGRVFTLEEEQPGHAASVAIVSYGYWTRHNHDASILGSQVLINGRSYTIVGVLPKTFTGTLAVLSPEVWLPLSAFEFVAPNYTNDPAQTLGNRKSEQLLLIGRFKQGVTAASAGAALKTVAANLERAYPVEQKDQTFVTAPLSRFSISDDPPDDSEFAAIAPMLLGMAAVVLLVACLNLANMLLARGTARRKEIAIRLALGGSRWRVVRQLLTEGLLLAFIGGAAGLLVGVWASQILALSMRSLLPLDVVWNAGPNLPTMLVTFGFCLLGTVAFALGPALKLSRNSVIGDLKEHAGDDVVRRRWRFLPRNPLVVVQIAFSLALLTAAALFIRGANKAAWLETGLHVEKDLMLEVDASLGGFDPQRAEQLYRTLSERLAALPGVQHVSIAAAAPFGMVSLSRSIQRAGMHVGKDDKPASAAEGLAYSSRFNGVGADYFATMGIPILRGRTFTISEATQSNGPPVAIIDEALAKKLWPDGDALGQRIQFASDTAPRAKRDDGGNSMGIGRGGQTNIKEDEAVEVVGIAANVRGSVFEKRPRGAIYLPFARGFQNNVFFFVQFSSMNQTNIPDLANAIRRAVRETDPTLPVLALKTFPQHLETNMEIWVIRAGATLFSIFGALALALAIVGVYGVKAYSVARRTREIGIRMALGARPNGVQWMIIREGIVMLAGGVVIGLLLAAATGKLLSGMLYQVGALDPIAFSTAPLVLGAATLVATWLPARRATRISPMTALRTE